MLEMPILQTARLLIRPFAMEDLPEAHRLFYAIFPSHQRQGYASEAAQALVDYAFQSLGLRRAVATTAYDNLTSQGVMRKLGMCIEKSPLPEPPWLQVVGVIENPSSGEE